MFILKSRPSYFWPVKFSIPAADGGLDEFSFQAEFKRLQQARIDRIVDALNDDKSGITDQSIAEEVFIGWKEITDESGDALLFSADARSQLLDVPRLRKAVVQAFFASLLEHPRKN